MQAIEFKSGEKYWIKFSEETLEKYCYIGYNYQHHLTNGGEVEDIYHTFGFFKCEIIEVSSNSTTICIRPLDKTTFKHSTFLQYKKHYISSKYLEDLTVIPIEDGE